MSNDPTFDRHVAEVLENSQRNASRYPDDPEWTDEAWQARMRVLCRLIYRAGTRAGLNYRYGQLEDSVERVRWLVDHDLATQDVAALLNEVEHWQEKAGALQGSYGVTDSDIRSMLGEGFHTAFRKAVDSPYATVIHRLIRDLEPGEYGAVVDFTAGPLIDMLHEAEMHAVWPTRDPELVQAMMRWAMSKGAVITRHWFGLALAEDTTQDQESTS